MADERKLEREVTDSEVVSRPQPQSPLLAMPVGEWVSDGLGENTSPQERRIPGDGTLTQSAGLFWSLEMPSCCSSLSLGTSFYSSHNLLFSRREFPSYWA